MTRDDEYEFSYREAVFILIGCAIVGFVLGETGDGSKFGIFSALMGLVLGMCLLAIGQSWRRPGPLILLGVTSSTSVTLSYFLANYFFVLAIGFTIVIWGAMVVFFPVN